MGSRHSVIYALFFALMGGFALLGPATTHSAPPVDDEAIPPQAMAALQDGRYLRASLILRDYLASRSDTTEAAIMLAARAEAGWGDWDRVRELLEGRSWLDRVAAGYAWHLLGRSQLELGEYRQGSESLARFLAGTDHDDAGREQGIAEVRRATALVQQREFDGAVSSYDRAAVLLPQIADWLDVFSASAAAAAGDTATVRDRLSRVDTELALEWGGRVEVRARRQAGDRAGAIAAALRTAERATSSSRRAAAWTLAGQLRQERGDARGARAAFVSAVDAAQGSTAAVDAARSLSAMSSASPEERLLAGRVYLRHGNSQRGVAGLTSFLESDRGSPTEREQVLYEIANAHFRAGDYGQAERELLAVAASVHDAGVAADALFTAARAQYRDGRSAAARYTLLRIMREHPVQPAAARAAFLTADLDHDDGSLESAAHFYRTAIALAPESSEAAVARMRLGGIAYAAGRFDEALAWFDELRTVALAGRVHLQATFWTGRALLRLGRDVEARSRLAQVRRLDPLSYYGGIAADLLGEDIWHRRLEPAPPHNDRFDAQVRRALARVDLLREIGWTEAAAFEMERVRRHFAQFDGALYTLAEALNARGFTHAGVALGWEIQRREGAWNLRLLRIVYPFPYHNIILAEARERNVDPFLVAALIRQESMFVPDAQSGAGARGLMQVMPRTGQSLAGRVGVARFQTDMLFQPELNIAMGTLYLADQLRTYGSRLDAVLAAYNAGPGRVARWQRFPEYSDHTLFAERIPFDETRDYVRIVQNNRRIYSALYGHLGGAAR